MDTVHSHPSRKIFLCLSIYTVQSGGTHGKLTPRGSADTEEWQMASKWSKRKKIILASVITVLVAGGGIGTYTLFAHSKTATTVTTFQKTTVQTGTVSDSISASGSVTNSSQVTLTSTNAGTVDSVLVAQGDTVTAGQEIAHVTASSTTNNNISQLQSALDTAEQNLSSAQQNLDALTVKSPIAGKVKSITAASGDDLSTIKTLGDLCVISTERSMTVSFNATQTVSMGDGVTVTDTATGKSYSGTVTSTSSGSAGTTAQKTGSSGSITATISSDDPGVDDTASVSLNGAEIGTGTFSLVKYVSIANSGSGTVSSVKVSENQMVAKNQVLFQLSSDSLQQQVDSKKQAVEDAQTALDDANAQAESEATITSPISGVVAQLSVAANDSVSAGGTIAVVVDPNAMQTVVSVDELDISSVKVGQQATITLDAISGKTFSGTVTSVDQIGTASNGVASYSVTVSIADAEGILVGMTTDVEIITQSADNVLTVSADALLEKNGTTAYVLLADKLFDANGNSVKLENMTTSELVKEYGTQVTIGMSSENEAEIQSGLSEGDSIAIPLTVNQSALTALGETSSKTTRGEYGNMGGMGEMGGGNFTGGTNRTTGGTTGTNGTTGTTQRAAG